MVPTIVARRPSDLKIKLNKNLKQPELERSVNKSGSHFSFSTDFQCKSEGKSDSSEIFEECDDAG
jgi:hypothetical protein